MKLFSLFLVLLFSTTAFAQKHMIEFSTNSFLFGEVAFNLEKERTDQNAEETKNAFLYLNYAYAIASQVQIGVRGQYLSSKGEDFAYKSNTLALGVIYNFSAKLNEALYTSLYSGFEWDKSEQSGSNTDRDESLVATVALGKRFPLSFLGVENITYSPEISFSSMSSTQSTSDSDWSQDLAFKFLQFSVLF